MQNFLILNLVVRKVTARLLKVNVTLFMLAESYQNSKERIARLAALSSDTLLRSHHVVTAPKMLNFIKIGRQIIKSQKKLIKINKGGLKNALEKLHIYNITRSENQINDKCVAEP